MSRRVAAGVVGLAVVLAACGESENGKQESAAACQRSFADLEAATHMVSQPYHYDTMQKKADDLTAAAATVTDPNLRSAIVATASAISELAHDEPGSRATEPDLKAIPLGTLDDACKAATGRSF